MKSLNNITFLLVFLFATLAYSQTPVIIATIPTSGTTGTIIVDEDDLKDAFETEFNNGATFNTVWVEKLDHHWYLLGSGTMPGGGSISAGVQLSVSSSNGTFTNSTGPTLLSCYARNCSSGCKIKKSEDGCTACPGGICDFGSAALQVAGELGGFGYQ